MELRLIPDFSGYASQNVVEWLEKAELVCDLRGIAHLETVIPLRLTGGAFAVYQQVPDADKLNVGKITKALRTAFAVDSFTAYEQFVRRRLQPGETVDVFLAELRRPCGELAECRKRFHPCGELAECTSRFRPCGELAECTSRFRPCGELADDEELPLFPGRRGAEGESSDSE